jgi:hypothetical protein
MSKLKYDECLDRRLSYIDANGFVTTGGLCWAVS